jgi:uncharacterized protein (DUF486 family)
MWTVLLLILSNVFMTFAWYGHLKFRSAPLVVTILASWLIALPEYALQVPANRLGYFRFSAAQLKILQEAISITVFLVFSVLYLHEWPTWRSGLAFVLIFAAVVLVATSDGGRLQGHDPTAATEPNRLPTLSPPLDAP